jgi:hypothetical protein
MSNIVRATVSIVGVRPLLQHHFGPSAIPLEKQERTGVAGNDPEEWRRTCLVTPEGQLYVKGTYVFGMLVAAAKNTKKGKGSIQPLVAATLQIEEAEILLDRFLPSAPDYDNRKPVYIDVSGVVNPGTKARNVRYRLAAAAGWRITFTLKWDKVVVGRELMMNVVSDAGTLVGLGNGRKIGDGRFEVERFEILDAEGKTAA